MYIKVTLKKKQQPETEDLVRWSTSTWDLSLAVFEHLHKLISVSLETVQSHGLGQEINILQKATIHHKRKRNGKLIKNTPPIQL